jgi:hypothetical protein
LVFTVGTTTRDAANRDWAYLVWQAAAPELLANRQFAIYAKPGDAASTNHYARKALVRLQTDPRTITALLARAANLGENPAELDQAINGWFERLLPVPALSLPEKISAVLVGGVQDEDHLLNLIHLSRVHPAMGFCLGCAHAELIPPGKTTFEVREFSPERGQDLGVIGRVTLEAGAPPPLPAPGPPVVVPEKVNSKVKGHLNLKFRWAVPPELRRLGILNYGFNLYRMPKALAEKRFFDRTPPATATLLQLAATDPDVKRVNRVPVLIDKDFDSLTVTNFTAGAGDPDTYFLADDNDRFKGGQTFRPNEQFYYFLTARDLLSRDGLVTPGTLATVRDRMPPPAPHGVRVLNDYAFLNNAGRQALKILWKQNPGPAAGDDTANYYVYRWDSPAQMNQLASNPNAHRIAGPIAHRTNATENSFLDTGATAPKMPADAGRTWWYSVRAEDPNGNLSGNSPPAYGVLRDRVGPAPPIGEVLIQTVTPKVLYVGSTNLTDAKLDPDQAHFRLVCGRIYPGLQWAEFCQINANQTNVLARRYFPQNPVLVTATQAVDFPLTNVPPGLAFGCRVGAANGKISALTVAPAPPVSKVAAWQLNFAAILEVAQVVGQPGRNTHEPRPAGLGNNRPIEVVIRPQPTSKEWKLYRRIDGGPWSLAAQGQADGDLAPEVRVADQDMPASAGTVEYAAQAADEHGNSSTLELVGGETRVAVPPPTPMLSPIQPAGDERHPKMVLRWFCPPAGVERFTVWLATAPPSYPVSLSPDLTTNLTVCQGQCLIPLNLDGTEREYAICLYRSGRVGGNFGPGPEFTVLADARLGYTHWVWVDSLSPDGLGSGSSNFEPFTWTPTNQPSAPVPWPARPLPEVATNVVCQHLEARVVNYTNATRFLGVRLGQVITAFKNVPIVQNEPPFRLPGQVDPAACLTNTLGGPLLPVMLYRYQTTNAAFPKVSGDVTQVSPLIETIARQYAVDPELGSLTVIRDPFLVLKPAPGSGKQALHDLFLVDTQPVLVGARYKYLLMRFKPNGEIEHVLPTNEVEVP